MPKVVPGANSSEAAEFDDQCPDPKKEQQSQKSDKDMVHSDSYTSKKKKSEAE